MDRKALLEAAKEFGRIIIIAILPVLIDALAQPVFSIKATAIAIFIAALRAVDRYIHENENTKSNGLVPF